MVESLALTDEKHAKKEINSSGFLCLCLTKINLVLSIMNMKKVYRSLPYPGSLCSWKRASRCSLPSCLRLRAGEPT